MIDTNYISHSIEIKGYIRMAWWNQWEIENVNTEIIYDKYNFRENLSLL
jgi:hypothetical protein